MGVVDNAVGADKLKVHDVQPSPGLAVAVAEQQPAIGQEAAPPCKRTILKMKDVAYACLANLFETKATIATARALPFRMKCTMCDTHLGMPTSLVLNKHRLDSHLASKSQKKVAAEAA